MEFYINDNAYGAYGSTVFPGETPEDHVAHLEYLDTQLDEAIARIRERERRREEMAKANRLAAEIEWQRERRERERQRHELIEQIAQIHAANEAFWNSRRK